MFINEIHNNMGIIMQLIVCIDAPSGVMRMNERPTNEQKKIVFLFTFHRHEAFKYSKVYCKRIVPVPILFQLLLLLSDGVDLFMFTFHNIHARNGSIQNAFWSKWEKWRREKCDEKNSGSGQTNISMVSHELCETAKVRSIPIRINDMRDCRRRT